MCGVVGDRAQRVVLLQQREGYKIERNDWFCYSDEKGRRSNRPMAIVRQHRQMPQPHPPAQPLRPAPAAAA